MIKSPQVTGVGGAAMAGPADTAAKRPVSRIKSDRRFIIPKRIYVFIGSLSNRLRFCVIQNH
jgi:hypothetical protein